MTNVRQWISSMREFWERARQRRIVRWGADALFFVVVIWVAGVVQGRDHLAAGATPDVTLPRLDGATLRLQSLVGKPTLVAFWAPWCGVCKVESQNISWVMHLVGSSANVVSVASEFDDVGEVKRFMADHGADYPVLLGSRAVTQQFSIEGFPTVYFLDAEGRVKRSVVGYTSTLGLLARLFL